MLLTPLNPHLNHFNFVQDQPDLLTMSSMWNTFRFVALNQQQATLVFVLHSHLEFYFTQHARKLTFDLTDLMDIDESRKSDFICRMALKPVIGLQQQKACSTGPAPLTLLIQFESALSYDRFITLLVRSQVFYHHKTAVSRVGWFARRTLSISLKINDYSKRRYRSELKLVPSRIEQLHNYLHLLRGWKDNHTNSV